MMCQMMYLFVRELGYFCLIFVHFYIKDKIDWVHEYFLIKIIYLCS